MVETLIYSSRMDTACCSENRYRLLRPPLSSCVHMAAGAASRRRRLGTWRGVVWYGCPRAMVHGAAVVQVVVSVFVYDLCTPRADGQLSFVPRVPDVERSADVPADVIFRTATHGDRCMRKRGSGLAAICPAYLWCADRGSRNAVER